MQKRIFLSLALTAVGTFIASGYFYRDPPRRLPKQAAGTMGMRQGSSSAFDPPAKTPGSIFYLLEEPGATHLFRANCATAPGQKPVCDLKEVTVRRGADRSSHCLIEDSVSMGWETPVRPAADGALALTPSPDGPCQFQSTYLLTRNELIFQRRTSRETPKQSPVCAQIFAHRQSWRARRVKLPVISNTFQDCEAIQVSP